MSFTLKAFACVGVVFTHVSFPTIIGEAIVCLSQFAVPLFFLIAGYYSYGCDKNKIRIRLIKILKILLFSSSLMLFYNVIIEILNNNLNEWIIKNFTFAKLIKFIIFCKIDWAGHLWYLIAMAETYLVWLLIIKYNKQNESTKTTYILLLCNALLTTIVDTLGLNWSYGINFLFSAVPWFLIGYLTKNKYEDKLNQLIGNRELIMFAIFGWFITLIPVLLKTKINFNYFGVLITAPSLFFFGIKNPGTKPSLFLDYLGDKLSLYIYIYHLPVSYIIRILSIKVFKVNIESILYMTTYPIITLLFTILISIVFYEISKAFSFNKLFK